MSPLHVANKLENFGFWYTFWTLREGELSRTKSLWLIWVGWNYLRHRDGKTLLRSMVG